MTNTAAVSEATQSEADAIRTEVDGPLLWIRIDRAAKRNAITSVMYGKLAAVLDEADRTPSVRTVVITGFNGTDHDVFSSGNDLADFLANPPEDESSNTVQFLKSLARFSKPLVAAVSGPAVGIGMTLLLHCELVYAADNARLQFPFTSLGVVPEAGSTQLLARSVGHVKASELLLLGEPFTAQQALEWGLVNAVVPAAEVEALARSRALKLAAQPAAALRATKALIRSARNADLNSVILEEMRVFAERLNSPEAQEAVSAFLQKRKPDFTQFD
ncbi:MAG TPA: enoyl-CoA hydratase [Pedomonas sp.]|uniref:enoyl-CoA hydratase n=1 Tax=Pedomonas sp. TaxID=2976421 RepID=UPI002F416ADE